jgi:hypothetical protein
MGTIFQNVRRNRGKNRRNKINRRKDGLDTGRQAGRY